MRRRRRSSGKNGDYACRISRPALSASHLSWRHMYARLDSASAHLTEDDDCAVFDLFLPLSVDRRLSFPEFQNCHSNRYWETATASLSLSLSVLSCAMSSSSRPLLASRYSNYLCREALSNGRSASHVSIPRTAIVALIVDDGCDRPGSSRAGRKKFLIFGEISSIWE